MHGQPITAADVLFAIAFGLTLGLLTAAFI